MFNNGITILGKYDEALLAVQETMAKAEETAGGYDLYRYVHFLEMAEIFEEKGDLKEAIKYYKLVLEINPDVKSAAERLRAIQQKNA